MGINLTREGQGPLKNKILEHCIVNDIHRYTHNKNMSENVLMTKYFKGRSWSIETITQNDSLREPLWIRLK